jgi:hypothetical protein
MNVRQRMGRTRALSAPGLLADTAWDGASAVETRVVRAP